MNIFQFFGLKFFLTFQKTMVFMKIHEFFNLALLAIFYIQKTGLAAYDS